MKKIINLSLLALLAGLTSSCIGGYNSTGVSPALVNSWKDKEFLATIDNSVAISKTGESCVTNVLSLVTSGDSSIESAKKAAGIKNVNHVYRTYSGIAFIFQKGCTVVVGN